MTNKTSLKKYFNLLLVLILTLPLLLPIEGHADTNRANSDVLGSQNWQGTTVTDQNGNDVTDLNTSFIGLAKYEAATNRYEFFDAATGLSRGDSGIYFLTQDQKKRVLISQTRNYNVVVDILTLNNELFTYRRMGKLADGSEGLVDVAHIPYQGTLDFTTPLTDLVTETGEIDKSKSGRDILADTKWQGTVVYDENGLDVSAYNGGFLGLARYEASTNRYEFFDKISGQTRGDYGYYDVIRENKIRTHVSLGMNYAAAFELTEINSQRFTYTRMGKNAEGADIKVTVEHEPYLGDYPLSFTFGETNPEPEIPEIEKPEESKPGQDLLGSTNWQGTTVTDQNGNDVTALNAGFIGLARYDATTNRYEFYDAATGLSRGDSGIYFLTQDQKKRVLISQTRNYNVVVDILTLNTDLFTYQRMGKLLDGSEGLVDVAHVPYAGELEFTTPLSELVTETGTIDQNLPGRDILANTKWQGTVVYDENGQDVSAYNSSFLGLARYEATSNRYEFFDKATGQPRGDFGYYDVLRGNKLRAHVSLGMNYAAAFELTELNNQRFTYSRMGKNAQGEDIKVTVEHEPYQGEFALDFNFGQPIPVPEVPEVPETILPPTETPETTVPETQLPKVEQLTNDPKQKPATDAAIFPKLESGSTDASDFPQTGEKDSNLPILLGFISTLLGTIGFAYRKFR